MPPSFPHPPSSRNTSDTKSYLNQDSDIPGAFVMVIPVETGIILAKDILVYWDVEEDGTPSMGDVYIRVCHPQECMHTHLLNPLLTFPLLGPRFKEHTGPFLSLLKGQPQ